MARVITHVPTPTDIDAAEDRELRRLLKLLLKAFRAHVAEVKIRVPSYQLPPEVRDLRDAVTEILGRHDAMRTP